MLQYLQMHGLKAEIAKSVIELRNGLERYWVLAAHLVIIEADC